MGLLLGVLVVLGLTIGEARTEGDSFSVTLGGAWTAVYLSVVRLSCFIAIQVTGVRRVTRLTAPGRGQDEDLSWQP